MNEPTQGTQILSPVVCPGSTSHYSTGGAGGYHELPSLVRRDTLPVAADGRLHYDRMGSGHRRQGMLVVITADADPAKWPTYRLEVPGYAELSDEQKVSGLADNANWKPYAVAPSGAVVDTAGSGLYKGEYVYGATYQVGETVTFQNSIHESAAPDNVSAPAGGDSWVRRLQGAQVQLPPAKTLPAVEEIIANGLPPVDISYQDLVNLMNNYQLIPGQEYKLLDFQTINMASQELGVTAYMGQTRAGLANMEEFDQSQYGYAPIIVTAAGEGNLYLTFRDAENEDYVGQYNIYAGALQISLMVEDTPLIYRSNLSKLTGVASGRYLGFQLPDSIKAYVLAHPNLNFYLSIGQIRTFDQQAGIITMSYATYMGTPAEVTAALRLFVYTDVARPGEITYLHRLSNNVIAFYDYRFVTHLLHRSLINGSEYFLFSTPSSYQGFLSTTSHFPEQGKVTFEKDNWIPVTTFGINANPNNVYLGPNCQRIHFSAEFYSNVRIDSGFECVISTCYNFQSYNNLQIACLGTLTGNLGSSSVTQCLFLNDFFANGNLLGNIDYSLVSGSCRELRALEGISKCFFYSNIGNYSFTGYVENLVFMEDLSNGRFYGVGKELKFFFEEYDPMTPNENSAVELPANTTAILFVRLNNAILKKSEYTVTEPFYLNGYPQILTIPQATTADEVIVTALKL